MDHYRHRYLASPYPDTFWSPAAMSQPPRRCISKSAMPKILCCSDVKLAKKQVDFVDSDPETHQILIDFKDDASGTLPQARVDPSSKNIPWASYHYIYVVNSNESRKSKSNKSTIIYALTDINSPDPKMVQISEKAAPEIVGSQQAKTRKQPCLVRQPGGLELYCETHRDTIYTVYLVRWQERATSKKEDSAANHYPDAQAYYEATGLQPPLFLYPSANDYPVSCPIAVEKPGDEILGEPLADQRFAHHPFRAPSAAQKASSFVTTSDEGYSHDASTADQIAGHQTSRPAVSNPLPTAVSHQRSPAETVNKLASHGILPPDINAPRKLPAKFPPTTVFQPPGQGTSFIAPLKSKDSNKQHFPFAGASRISSTVPTQNQANVLGTSPNTQVVPVNAPDDPISKQAMDAALLIEHGLSSTEVSIPFQHLPAHLGRRELIY